MNDSTTLQQEVRQELEWEPSMNASHLGVEVSAPGVVTLTGTVATYPEKVIAERTAKRVPGVRAVANDIEVQPIGSRMRNDTDLAQAVFGSWSGILQSPMRRSAWGYTMAGLLWRERWLCRFSVRRLRTQCGD